MLSFWPWLDRVTGQGVERSDAFFHRHGSKAVFLGRFLPIIRSTLGWMAGVGRMPVLRFMLWNIAGAVAWGLAVGLAAYYLGAAVVDAIQRDALIGVVVLLVLALAFVGLHLLKRRYESKA